MKRLIAFSLTLLLGSSAATAEKVVEKVSWADRAKEGRLLNGEVQRTEPPDAFDALKLDSPDNQPKAGPGTVHLSPLRIEEYPVPSKASPEPRPSPPSPGGPTKPGSGARAPKPSPGASQSTPARKAWWDDRTSGLIGGIAGSIVGCIGGLIGTLTSLGRARRLTLGLAWGTIVFGLGCLVAGAVALSLSQPFAVWYPLLLAGGISAGVMGSLLPTIRRRYAETELRKMAAMDVHTGAN